MVAEHDAVVVGGSLAGCTTAVLLARQGVSVALLERSPDPGHFKRTCTHHFQPPGVEVLERLGLKEWCLANGGRMSGGSAHSRYGWVRARGIADGMNIRREWIDPKLRALAVATPGVDYVGGARVTGLLRDAAGRPSGVVAGGQEYRARLVVGADGRGASVAKLAGVAGRVRPHGRFGYIAYYEGLDLPADGPSRLWMEDPDLAAVFPQAGDVAIVATLVAKSRWDEFKADVDTAAQRCFLGLADGPDLRAGRRISGWIGRMDMPNVRRRAAVPGLAFVGDAAQASDPLWGVGCGFALSAAEWLAEEAGPALVAGGDVDGGLERYHARFRGMLAGHHFLMSDYASGRRFRQFEKLMFQAAVRDQRVANAVTEFGFRGAPVRHTLTPAFLARATAAAIRRPR